MSYREMIERALNGRSVNSMSKAWGITQSTLNRYKLGEFLPSYDDALLLAHEAGIDEGEALKILAAEAAARKQKKEKISKSFKQLIELLNPRRDWLPA